MYSVLNQIQLKYQSLSKLEKKVADYVIHHSNDLLNIHIKEMAAQIDVSVATITRFCHKIGAKSFVEFKILLRDAVRNEQVSDHALESVNQMYRAVVESTEALTDLTVYQRACQWIKAAKRVHIFGLGSSGLSAEELKLRISRMGLKVDTHLDSHSIIIGSSLVSAEDVVIAISSSGETKEVVDGVGLAKRNQAKIIAITNYTDTSLATNSDLLLYTYSMHPFRLRGLLNSQLSIHYVLDILTMLLIQEEDLLQSYRETLKALDEYKKI